MEREKLKEYLNKVMELEQDIYLTDRTIEELGEEKKRIPKLEEVIYPKLEKIYEVPAEPGFGSKYIGAFCKPNATQIGITVAGWIIFWILFQNFFLGLLFGLLSYVLSTLIPVLTESDLESEKYKSEMDRIKQAEKRNMRKRAEYNNAVEQARRKYDRECQKKPLIDNEIDNQIVELRKSRVDTMEALEKLYDLDIIYSKYRSIVPISRFCEYMESGRREKLQGADGMYDLYEQELIAKAIVGGLGEINKNILTMGEAILDVSRQLAGVQHNQMLLYNAINESNEIAKDIRSNTREILEKNAEMAMSMRTVQERTDVIHAAMQREAVVTNTNIEKMRKNAEDIKKYTEYDLRQRYGTVPKDPW